MKEFITQKLKQVENLPTMSGTAFKVMQMALNPDIDISEMANVIKQDVALSTRILTAVNSSYYSLSSTVKNLNQAVVLLGQKMVKNIALSVSVIDSLNEYISAEHYQFLLNRSINNAVACKSFALHSGLMDGEEAFVIGLLTELPLFFLAHILPDEFSKTRIEATERHIDFYTALQHNLQINISGISTQLASHWSLPQNISIAMAYYRNPQAGLERLEIKEFHPNILISYLGNLAAEIYTDTGKSLLISKLKESYHFYLKKDVKELEFVLNDLGAEITAAAKSFSVEIPAPEKYAAILESANLELAKLNIQYEKLYKELKNQAAELKMKNKKLASLTEELNKKNKMLQMMAEKDGLTGVFNHRYFQDFLNQQFSQAKRYNKPLSLIMMDIDHFKKFNDTYGHQFGDAVLKELVRVASSQTRESDILARYGGEEFAVILVDTDLRGAIIAAEKIRRAVQANEMEYETGEKVKVTISCGVSQITPHMKSTVELIELADQALYQSKKTGRNKVSALSHK